MRNFFVWAGTGGLALIMVGIVVWRTGQIANSNFVTFDDIEQSLRQETEHVSVDHYEPAPAPSPDPDSDSVWDTIEYSVEVPVVEQPTAEYRVQRPHMESPPVTIKQLKEVIELNNLKSPFEE